MPSLPDIPGKGLVSDGARRTGKVAAESTLAVIAVGGHVLRRIVRRVAGGGGEEAAATADPVAETPTAPSTAEANGGDPSGVEPGAETPPPPQTPPRPDPPKPAPPEPEPPAPEAGVEAGEAEPTGTDAPQKPEAEPGDRSKDKEPHHALSNPAEDPDPTEWPDPYDKRSDPLDPPDPDGEPFGEVPHVPPGAASTSEPHPSQDPEAGERGEPPSRENLDQ